jgi:hypothetical protein
VCVRERRPYGVKQIDQRILMLINARVKSIHDALQANAGSIEPVVLFEIVYRRCDNANRRHTLGPLAAFAKNFYHAPAVADAIKRIAG